MPGTALNRRQGRTSSVLVQKAAGNVTVVNQQLILINKTSGQATTVTLPKPPAGVYREVTVIDQKGDAGTNNITVQVASSGTINGATTYVIAQNFGYARFIFNGTEWNTNRLSAGAGGTLGASATPGTATHVDSLVLKKAIPDNTATSILTITAPNSEQAAALRLTFVASVINAGKLDSTRTALGLVVFDRTVGAALVGTAVALTNAGIATSGSATLTLAYSLTAAAGAVGAVNTMDVQVTLVKTGGTSEQIVVLAELINSEASGITMAAA